jgi:serine/threonine protein kinase
MTKLVAQLLRGLDHAHGEGLVHRDLKPENVIVEAGDVARIVDFGIAVLREPEDDSERLTASGMIVGTPLYMAPEQAKGEDVDHRADLYALGVIIYELIAGKPPFEGTAMEVALAKINQELPPIAGVDRLWEAFMKKLTARHRDNRFASAHDAVTVLEMIDRDPVEAAGALNVIDLERAIRTISLP